MRKRSPPSAVLLWHLASAALVVVMPGFLRFGSPFWNLSEGLAVQSPVMGVAYLSFAVLLMSRGAPLGRASIVLAGAAGIACFCMVTLLMLAWPGLTWSRVLVATSAGLGTSLGLLPHAFPNRWMLRLGPGAMCLTVAGGTIAISARGPAPIPDRIVAAGSHTIRIEYHTGLVDQGPPTGGGIDTYRDHLLLSNSVGEISRVRWDGEDPTVESLELVLPLEINRNEFIADVSVEAEDRNFRVMDLLVDTVSTPHRILVSHYVWHREERCLTIRVSATAMPGTEGGTTPAWDTVFESKPCISFSSTPGNKLTNHAGGRMAPAPDGRVMLSVGDMLYQPLLAQEPDADYGKILLLDRDGAIEPYSLGHRNPEGLMVARDGSVWASEHGPRGGDELNRILPGGNYGWPLATYGTAQDQTPSPLAEHRRDHGPFQEPVFTWIPSVGIANLIELSGAAFPDWRGDLLVASLNGRTLYRMRIREGRVLAAEEIGIGFRIRDLVQDPQGRVILYTDSGALVTIGRVAEENGQVAFAIHCSRCHEFQTGGQTVGPSLAGVLGREAASLRDWPYSAALRDLDIVWKC